MALPGMDLHPSSQPSHDWPGAAPARFTDKFTGKSLSRRICATENRNGNEANLARQGFSGYFTDTRGLTGTESKRIIRQQPSNVYQWKPGKRSLSEPGSFHWEKPEGLKAVEAPPPKVFSIRERRHIRQVQSKEEHGDRPIGPATVYRENGYRAADQIAQEVDITNEMARKARVNDLRYQRNGLDCRSLGDKPYRHPEYESKFHHVGGLIVGSTGVRGHFPKTEARNAMGVKLVDQGERRPVVSYAAKQRKQEHEDAEDEVVGLTRNVALDDQDVKPSWEAYALKECETANYEEYDTDDETALEGPELYPYEYKDMKKQQAPPTPQGAPAKAPKK